MIWRKLIIYHTLRQVKLIEVDFKIKQGGEIKIFTTCIETIFGCTFVVLAPEHPLLKTLQPQRAVL